MKWKKRGKLYNSRNFVSLTFGNTRYVLDNVGYNEVVKLVILYIHQFGPIAQIGNIAQMGNAIPN